MVKKRGGEEESITGVCPGNQESYTVDRVPKRYLDNFPGKKEVDCVEADEPDLVSPTPDCSSAGTPFLYDTHTF